LQPTPENWGRLSLTFADRWVTWFLLLTLIAQKLHDPTRIAACVRLVTKILDEAQSREALKKVVATLALMDGCRTSAIPLGAQAKAQ
jgi:hypothetical protein